VAQAGFHERLEVPVDRHAIRRPTPAQVTCHCAGTRSAAIIGPSRTPPSGDDGHLRSRDFRRSKTLPESGPRSCRSAAGGLECGDVGWCTGWRCRLPATPGFGRALLGEPCRARPLRDVARLACPTPWLRPAVKKLRRGPGTGPTWQRRGNGRGGPHPSPLGDRALALDDGGSCGVRFPKAQEDASRGQGRSDRDGRPQQTADGA
jgi:hypothetical protein